MAVIKFETSEKTLKNSGRRKLPPPGLHAIKVDKMTHRKKKDDWEIVVSITEKEHKGFPGFDYINFNNENLDWKVVQFCQALGIPFKKVKGKIVAKIDTEDVIGSTCFGMFKKDSYEGRPTLKLRGWVSEEAAKEMLEALGDDEPDEDDDDSEDEEQDEEEDDTDDDDGDDEDEDGSDDDDEEDSDDSDEDEDEEEELIEEEEEEEDEEPAPKKGKKGSSPSTKSKDKDGKKSAGKAGGKGKKVAAPVKKGKGKKKLPF